MCPKRLYVLTTTAALLASLATPPGARAQSSMDLPDDMSMGGGAVVQPQAPHLRSVFLGTIAALLAQRVGGAFFQGVAGSITRWFEGSDRGEQTMRAPDAPAMPPMNLDAPRVAGVAYEVHLLDGQGNTRAVDPSRHAFNTGDRFQVHFRPALPGRVTVSNIDPNGKVSRIDQASVAAGQLTTLGPYRFVDAKGRERLKLRLEPCDSPVLQAASRSIVKVGTASRTDAALRIGDCSQVLSRGISVKTRAIQKASMEGTTNFALDPLGREEVASGQIDAREVVIALQHR